MSAADVSHSSLSEAVRGSGDMTGITRGSVQGTGLGGLCEIDFFGITSLQSFKSAKSSHFKASKCLLACLLASLQSQWSATDCRADESAKGRSSPEPSQPGLAKEAGAISVDTGSQSGSATPGPVTRVT